MTESTVVPATEAPAETPLAGNGLIDAVLLAFLVVSTLVNLVVSESHDSSRAWWIALVLGVAFAKAVAIGCHYMALAKAPRGLLLAFVGWAIAFFVLTVLLAAR